MVDYLWKIIDIAKTNNLNNKSKLAGNITQSLLLDDIDSFFYKSVCIPLVKHYRKNNPLRDDPVAKNAMLGLEVNLVLNSIWVNYKCKTEFNPYHEHSGVYSFAIWLKIPYDLEVHKKLPQYSEINDQNIKAVCFEF